MNIGDLVSSPEVAVARVLGMQSKLHRWAGEDGSRRFDDLYNLVADPAFLVVAWRRVRGNTGSRTAGVDGRTAYDIESERGVEAFLDEVRDQLKSRTFHPLPVRERLIPKSGGKVRRLGIPVIADRVVQASLKLVLEPIFEQDFQSCSYGFRPKRRAHDAIAEIRHFGDRSYEWVVEGDIEACFDSISHSALMGRVGRRVGDKRVLALVKAFCKAGILTEFGQQEKTLAGTPQGGILSPLMANIALSVLDEYYVGEWQSKMGTNYERVRLRRQGRPTWRLVRFADDWVALVAGTRAHAEALRDEIAAVLAPMGLRLSPTKTVVVHLEQGFDFLGHHIQRRYKRGTGKRYVYTYPAKDRLAAQKRKVKALTRRNEHPDLRTLLAALNPVLRGWCNYFRHGASKETFSYLAHYTWWRVARWIRKRHKRLSWSQLLRRYFHDKWTVAADGVTMFDCATTPITRYLYRGARIPTPWSPVVA